MHTSCLLIVWKLARCNALVKGKASTAKELQQLLAVELLVVGAVGTMKAECLCSRCHFGVKGPGCCAEVVEQVCHCVTCTVSWAGPLAFCGVRVVEVFPTKLYCPKR